LLLAKGSEIEFTNHKETIETKKFCGNLIIFAWLKKDEGYIGSYRAC
jgi:hypothetical protein